MKPTFSALLLLIPLLPAAPGVAQTGIFSETGYVNIWYRVSPGGTRFGTEAADILDGFLLDEFVIGETSGTPTSGTVSMSSVGVDGAPRALGNVNVIDGHVDITGSFVDAAIDVEALGGMSVLLSDVFGSLNVNGSFDCQTSTLEELTVLDGGNAVVSGCALAFVSTVGAATLSIGGSTIDGNPNFRGTTTVDSTTITGVSGTIVEGVIQLGEPGLPTSWDASGTITVGQNTHTTDLVVSESTIESGTAVVRGGGATDLTLEAAALWRAIDLFQFLGGTVTADVNGASRIESLGDLWIGLSQVTVRSGTGTDSRIDVAGDLELGRTGASTVANGKLTIEDGGVVDVDGTLTIHPLATLDLNGGVLRVGALDPQGTLNENGGTLIVPEPDDAAAPLAGGFALAGLRRWRTSSSGSRFRA